MKRLTIFALTALLVLGLAACKKEPTAPPAPEDKGYDSFRKETTEMTVEEAETYLEENTDDTVPAYKEALYTVTENTVATVIEEAREQEQVTASIQKVFSGIYFKYREGTDFTDPVIKQKLFMQGDWELQEDGWYRFTFIDRTLAEGAITMDGDHALQEYTDVIELLLSDNNVILKPLE